MQEFVRAVTLATRSREGTRSPAGRRPAGSSACSTGSAPRSSSLAVVTGCKYRWVSDAEQQEPSPDTFYAAVGGTEVFEKLVHRFYAGVTSDPLLRPLYPEEDLGPAEERLRMFLVQYWGGPRTYSERRGHPRLRMRHMPFAVTPAARDAWLRHMRESLDELNLPEQYEKELWAYLMMAADSLVNSAG